MKRLVESANSKLNSRHSRLGVEYHDALSSSECCHYERDFGWIFQQLGASLAPRTWYFLIMLHYASCCACVCVSHISSKTDDLSIHDDDIQLVITARYGLARLELEAMASKYNYDDDVVKKLVWMCRKAPSALSPSPSRLKGDFSVSSKRSLTLGKSLSSPRFIHDEIYRHRWVAKGKKASTQSYYNEFGSLYRIGVWRAHSSSSLVPSDTESVLETFICTLQSCAKRKKFKLLSSVFWLSWCDPTLVRFFLASCRGKRRRKGETKPFLPNSSSVACREVSLILKALEYCGGISGGGNKRRKFWCCYNILFIMMTF